MKVERRADNPKIISKISEEPADLLRLAREVEVSKRLAESGCAPRIYHVDHAKIEAEFIEGESLAEWIKLRDDYSATAIKFSRAKERLRQYVELEEAMLDAGVMYRDLNLGHVIFTEKQARIIDLEAASLKEPGDERWRMQSWRGTWETMAPEEFVATNSLTRRTASYRVAIIIHLVLTGGLPIRRAASKSAMYRARLDNTAQVSSALPNPARKALAASLQVNPTRRHATPGSLWHAIEKSYGVSQ